MIAVAFRFSNHDWMGLAVAANMKELFWQIDQHGDPYDVEIMSLKSGSVCIKQKLNDEDEYGEPDTPDLPVPHLPAPSRDNHKAAGEIWR